MSILQLVAYCSPLTWSCSSLTSPAQAASTARQGRLWGDPLRLLAVTHAPQLGQWAPDIAQRFSPRALPSPSQAGRPRVYADLSVFLTSLVATAWYLSYEGITAALAQDARLARALGYPTCPRRTISPAQYSRRIRGLGLLPSAPHGQAFPSDTVLPAPMEGGDATPVGHRTILRLPQALLWPGGLSGQRSGRCVWLCIGGAYCHVTRGARRHPIRTARPDDLAQSRFWLLSPSPIMEGSRCYKSSIK